MFGHTLNNILRPFQQKIRVACADEQKNGRTLTGVFILLLTSFSSHSLTAIDLPLKGPSGETILGLGVLYDAAYSPDGNTIATCGALGTLLFDAETGELLQIFGGHAGWVNSLVYSPDGKHLLTGSGDGIARLWDTTTGSEIRVFHLKKGINAVAFSPDGNRVLALGSDDSVKLWNGDTGAEIWSLEGRAAFTFFAGNSIAFSPDGTSVLIGGVLLNVKTGQEIWTFGGEAVAFSPDGRSVLTGSRNGTAILWDLETGSEIRRFSGLSWVSSVAFSPDGSQVWTSTDYGVTSWNTQTGSEIRTIRSLPGYVASISFLPDGNRVLLGIVDFGIIDIARSSARVLDVLTATEILSLEHGGVVASVAPSPDGMHILTGGNPVTLWNATTGQEVRTFSGSGPAAFSPDGSSLLIWGTLVDSTTGKRIQTFPGWGASLFSPDGGRVLRSDSARMHVWDAETGQEVSSFEQVRGRVAVFSPDCTKLFAGNVSGTLWDLELGEELWTITHEKPLMSVAFSPDGNRVLTAHGKSWSAEGTTVLWDASTGEKIQTFDARGPAVFSPDGNYVLIGDKILTADSADVIRVFEGHHRNVTSVAFTAGGSRVLTGGADGTTRIWDISDLGIAGGNQKVIAMQPTPPVGSDDLPVDALLNWESSSSVASHDVYLSSNLENVKDRAPSALVAENILEASFEPDRLEFNQTYYWRVDEVNGPPDFSVFPGCLWSFTTEPFSYPIANIQVTASGTFGPETGPEKTIDGSGLTDDLHGTAPSDMWLSNTIPAWIHYEFDRPYRLHEMWIWNANQLIEPLLGFGARDAVIEHSVDGSNWHRLAGVTQLYPAPASEDYAPNNLIDFQGVAAKYVRVTINAVYGIAEQASLSEVRFYYIPTYPTLQGPPKGMTIESLDLDLRWRPGREAATHEVILGEDRESVVDDRAIIATTTEPSLSLSDYDLKFASTYYWRINEVNESEVHSRFRGDTWSFTTPEYGVVDDMEAYANAPGREIWNHWVDGVNDPDNGAAVGTRTIYGTYAPEKSQVYEGVQSLPLAFDNRIALRSETTRRFSPPTDWQRGQPDILSIYFRGLATNDPASLYIVLKDSEGLEEFVIYPDPTATQMAQWTEWVIRLSDLTMLDLSSVQSLTIGIGGDASTGKGKMYFDSIRVGRPRPVMAMDPDPSAGSTKTEIHADLSWSNSAGALAYDVYLSTSRDEVEEGSPSALVAQGIEEASFDPGFLALETTYYWRVDSIFDSLGEAILHGGVWQFTTERGAASNPHPPVGSTATSRETALSWQAGKYAVNHNVYFSTDVEAVKSGSTDALVAEAIMDTQFDPGRLEFNKIYSWRVDAVTGPPDFAVSIGDVWHFTTETAYATHPRPANGASANTLDPILSWRPGAAAAVHQVFFSQEVTSVADDTALIATTTESSFDLSNQDLEYGQTYYWKVNEVNEAETPSVFSGDIWHFAAPEYQNVIDRPFEFKFNNKHISNPAYQDTQITHTFSSSQDWRRGNPEFLSLLFFRDAGDDSVHISLTIIDTMGRKVTISAPDPEMWRARQTTEWAIPMSQLSVLDLLRVKHLRFKIHSVAKGIIRFENIRVGTPGTL